MAVFGKKATIALLEAVVAEHGGDKAVKYCRYRNEKTGEPVCIVGQVLDKVGYLDRVYKDDFSNPKGTIPNGGAIDNYSDIVPEFSKKAIEVLSVAQAVQDGRSYYCNDRSWGAALKAAKEV